MEELRRIRQRCGFSQAETAVRAGLSPASIWRFEAGQRSPTVEQLSRLAEALGVEVVDFFPKAQAPLPFEDAGERGEAERRYEQLDDGNLFMFLGYHTHILKDQIGASRSFIELLKRLGEVSVWAENRFGSALWNDLNRVARDANILSEAKRVLAASEAGEVVPERLRIRAEEFMAAFLQLGEVKKEFDQAKADLQGHELAPGDPADIFDHSVGRRLGDGIDDYLPAWSAEHAELVEVPAKERDA